MRCLKKNATPFLPGHPERKAPWGTVGLAGGAAAPAGLSPGSLTGWGGVPCGVRSSSFFLPGTRLRARAHGSPSGLSALWVPRPGPPSRCPTSSAGHSGAVGAASASRSCQEAPPFLSPPQLTQPRAFLRASCSVAF